MENSREVALIFKTTAVRVRRLVRELRKAHSYAVPCIVTWPIQEGNSDYLKWISDETR